MNNKYLAIKLLSAISNPISLENYAAFIINILFNENKAIEKIFSYYGDEKCDKEFF